MAKETIIRCNRCGRGVPLSTVDVKGKELLCLNCQTGKTILGYASKSLMVEYTRAGVGKSLEKKAKCKCRYSMSMKISPALKRLPPISSSIFRWPSAAVSGR